MYKKSLLSIVLLLLYNYCLNLLSSVTNPSKVREVFEAEMILLVYRNDMLPMYSLHVFKIGVKIICFW